MSSSRPSSLFNHDDDACHSLEKARAGMLAEKRRRMRIFFRIILPLCLIGGGLALYFLQDALVSLFHKDYLIQQTIEEEKARNQKADSEEKKSVAEVKEFGRSAARMKMELLLSADEPGADLLSSVLLEAVETKPSEIHLVWKQEKNGAPRLKINGKSCELFGKGSEKACADGDYRKISEKLRRILNTCHAEIYGKNVLKPLHLTESALKAKSAETEGRREEYLPEFVGSENELKDRKRQTLLLLPKADTGAVSGKKRIE